MTELKTPKGQATIDLNVLSKTGARDKKISQFFSELKEELTAKITTDNLNIEAFEQEIIPTINEAIKEQCKEHSIQRKALKIREQALKHDLKRTCKYNSQEIFATIQLDSVQIHSAISALSKIIDEVVITIKKDGLHITFMDPSRILLSHVNITAETFFFIKEGKVGLNIDDLEKKLKATKSDNSTTTLKFGKTTLFIIKKPKKFPPVKDTLDMLDLETEEIPMDVVSSIQYTHAFHISKELMEYMFKNFNGLHSEVVEIIATKDQVKFFESGQIGTRELTFKKKDLSFIQLSENWQDILNQELESELVKEENEGKIEELKTRLEDSTGKSTFSLTFLQAICKFMDLLDKNENVSFNIRTDHPIRVEISKELVIFDESIKSKQKIIGNINIISILACRTEEADFDDDDEDNF